MGATVYDNLHRSFDSLLGARDAGSFPYKECVLGFMFTVFLWEQYLRCGATQQNAALWEMATIVP